MASSVFSYESCYFDDRQRCFHEHLQGRRQRFKVRTRRYVESGKAFFEVKLKGKRGQTDKSREVCDDYYSFVINDDEHQMLRKLYEKSYGKRFSYRLAPALHVSYRRFTLVSRSGRERITVDFNLGFETPTGRQAFIGDDFIIIETKTADGRGKSDRALKLQHVRSVNRLFEILPRHGPDRGGDGASTRSEALPGELWRACGRHAALSASHRKVFHRHPPPG